MKTMQEIADTNQQINEVQSYDDVIKKLTEAKEAGIPIDEGILGAIAGAVGGAVFGPKIMATICNVLGIDPKGSLGSLMTSRLIVTACATKLGWKI